MLGTPRSLSSKAGNRLLSSLLPRWMYFLCIFIVAWWNTMELPYSFTKECLCSQCPLEAGNRHQLGVHYLSTDHFMMQCLIGIVPEWQSPCWHSRGVVAIRKFSNFLGRMFLFFCMGLKFLFWFSVYPSLSDRSHTHIHAATRTLPLRDPTYVDECRLVNNPMIVDVCQQWRLSERRYRVSKKRKEHLIWQMQCSKINKCFNFRLAAEDCDDGESSVETAGTPWHRLASLTRLRNNMHSFMLTY